MLDLPERSLRKYQSVDSLCNNHLKLLTVGSAEAGIIKACLGLSKVDENLEKIERYLNLI